MGTNYAIHNARLDYRVGMPYGVFTYGLTDLDPKKEFILYSRYVAFIYNPGGLIFIKNNGDKGGSKETVGMRMTQNYKLDNDRQRIINEIVEMADKDSRRAVSPKEIYEGMEMAELTDYYRIKDHLPIEFDESDVILNIAEHELIYASDNNIFQPLIGTTAIAGLRQKKEQERFRYKDKNFYLSRHGSLMDLMDNWLNGRMTIKDLNAFIREDREVKPDEDQKLLSMREINIYTHDFNVTVKDDVGVDFRGNRCKWSQTTVKSITEVYDADPARPEEMTFRLNSGRNLAGWIVKKVKGQDTASIEQGMRYVSDTEALEEHYADYMRTKGLMVSGTDIYCIDLLEDPDIYEHDVNVPYEALLRFRQTGQLMDADEDMVQGILKKHAIMKLLGIEDISRVEVCYDPNTLKVMDLEIKYSWNEQKEEDYVY